MQRVLVHRRGRATGTPWSNLWSLFLCAALGGSLAGCSERPDRGGGADAERMALIERATGIREALAADSSALSGLESEWTELVADVEAWQKRTGRSDLRTGVDSVRTPQPGTAARDDDGGGGGDCPACRGYTLEGDRICLLSDEGDCFDLEDYSGRVCVYRCIWIGSGTEPARGETGTR